MLMLRRMFLGLLAAVLVGCASSVSLQEPPPIVFVHGNGDAVAGPVQWMTIRSDKNDKFAQPDGPWIGMRGVASNVTYADPELKGASNVVNLRTERVPEVDKNAPALVIMTRPRGYLDPACDKMAFNGPTPPPGAVLGAGVAT